MTDKLWVEPVGELIIARVRGEPTVELLRESQDQVVFLARDPGRNKGVWRGRIQSVLQRHDPGRGLASDAPPIR